MLECKNFCRSVGEQDTLSVASTALMQSTKASMQIDLSGENHGRTTIRMDLLLPVVAA